MIRLISRARLETLPGVAIIFIALLKIYVIICFELLAAGFLGLSCLILPLIYG